MEHPEFIQSWKEGKLEIDVNRSNALQIASSNILPTRYYLAHLFWSWVWLLSIKESAMQFMIDRSVENPEFYQFAVSKGVICIRQKPLKNIKK